MSKKKTKKKNAGPPKPMIQLSQCMIVKNEEKNIEKALGWAKGVAFEQIVVDTGSTDRTVELAEKMGATVYHFEWINDFGAAKNFAIEQAKGNWIAFLDADEYFTHEDAKKLMTTLKKIHSEPQLREQFLGLNTPWVHLDDEGNVFGVDEQVRMFRNVPSVRYIGKIHERLSLETINVIRDEDISIMHTGYARSAYAETGKAQRNVDLLRVEQAQKPDDLDIKVYLADSLRGKAREDGPVDGLVSDEEARQLYAEVAASDGIVDPMLGKKAHMFTVNWAVQFGAPVQVCEELCARALRKFPSDLDFEYYQARTMMNKGDFRTAWEMLKNCETKLMDPASLHKSTLIAIQPSLLFKEMIHAAQELGDAGGTVKYATMVLMEDKTQQNILSPYIATLLSHGTTEEEAFGLLGKIYDLNDANDLLMIARAAKDCNALDFARKAAEMLSNLVKG